MGIIDYINSIEAENSQLKKERDAIRQGAHNWKMRARAAEKRHKELVLEKVKMQDDHRAAMVSVAKQLAEVEKQLAAAQAKLLVKDDDINDLDWQIIDLEEDIIRLKAEVYDLTHEDCRGGECKCKRAS